MCPLLVVGRAAPHCDARAPQEVQHEKAKKKAKKAAELAAKLASRNVENMAVQPVFTVQAGLCGAPVRQPGADAADVLPAPARSDCAGTWRLLSMLALCVLHVFVLCCSRLDRAERLSVSNK